MATVEQYKEAAELADRFDRLKRFIDHLANRDDEERIKLNILFKENQWKNHDHELMDLVTGRIMQAAQKAIGIYEVTPDTIFKIADLIKADNQNRLDELRKQL